MSAHSASLESLSQVGTARSRAADEIVARLERLPFTRFHLHMASVLGVGTLFDSFDSQSMGVALTVIFAALAINPFNAGLLVGAAGFGQCLGAPLFGSLAERIGRQRAFVLALSLFGLLSLASALAWNFESLLVLRFVQGLGLGGEVPVAAVLFNECIRGKTRGKVVMIYQSLFVWGIPLAPLIGLAVLSSLPPAISWRVFFALGAIPLLVAVYAWFRLPESPRWLADKGRYAAADGTVRGIEASVRATGATLDEPQLRYRADIEQTRFGELFSPAYRRRTIMVYIEQFTATFVNGIVLGWFPTLYITLGGLPREQALLLALATGLIEIVLTYIMALTVDRFGRLPYLKLGFVVALLGAGLGVVVTSVLHFTPWPILFVAGTSMIVGCGVFNVLISVVWVPELYPTRMRAWASSTATGLSRFASAVGPVVVGALLGITFGPLVLFALIAVLMVVGLIAVSIAGIETRQRVLEEISA
jgi:putative MFS transporter